MDDRAISLILGSFRELIPMAEQADVLFNARLLDTCPDVYRLFAADVDPKDRTLVGTLRLIFGHINRFGAILPTVRALAGSHKVFRLIEVYYHELAEVLIWTLRRSLGFRFTTEVERAWHQALHAPVAAGPPLTPRPDAVSEEDGRPTIQIHRVRAVNSN
ncbi:hypothetical protein SAZ10_16455 [Mesorhizobium sp. BAC0120]|uniref:hypothetical protein n=1 Tax=Mesorhizobium sp. BAC0120 TaxID=3090670 RepID=UPI00298C00CD|nr:hypothetical protein [Mesorhizobium sp. BAC0120]MDW6023348.1 hypothetical protein [Mesorhizobium sp. BAC0120]